MNILFVADVSITRVSSGAERVLFEQANRLAAEGCTVHLLTRFDPEFHQQEQAKISGVTEWRYKANSNNPVRFLCDTLRNGGRLFKKLQQEIGFDCLFFHQPLSAVAVLWSGRLIRFKKIYICHSLWHEEYLSRTPMTPKLSERFCRRIQASSRKWIEKRALNRSDHIIVLSDYTREKLQNHHGILREKISIVPGGVDFQRFSPVADKAAVRQRHGLPGKGIMLFTLRNLEPRMGLSELLCAMKIIVSQIPDIHLVIGGDGPLKQSLADQVNGTGLSPQVSFTGFIDETILPDYYRMADLFVLPTLDLEGFGLITLEAMASGTPVLGTPVGGTREILEAFDAGLLFENTTTESMARLIIKACLDLLADPDTYEGLRRKSRAFVEARYSWERHTTAIMTLAAG